MAKTPTWQRAAGKSESGGLNEAGRRSLRAAGHDIKRPQPEGGARKDSFCARMKGMREKLTSSETANDPDSRINKSLRKWKCADGGPVDPYDGVQQAAKGGQVWDKPRPKKLGKPEPLSSKEKASAKAMAKAAGRPYPNLIDNMRAARADGGELVDPYDAVQNAANTDAFPSNFSAEDIQRAAHGATPAVPPVTVTEHHAPSTPQADMFRQAYNEAVPFPARALMSSVTGVHAPVTERDVTPEDRAEIIRQTERQQKINAFHEQAFADEPTMSPEAAKALQSFQDTRGKTSVTYDPSLRSTIYDPNQASMMQAASRAYNDPNYRIGTTLGSYNVYDTPKGRIVLDKYDFDMPNAASKNTPISASDFNQNFMQSLRMAIPKYAPNIVRPVAINLDAKPNRTYEYTGPAITTPSAPISKDETRTPLPDWREKISTTTPGSTTDIMPPRRPDGYADGGQVEGDVQFADDDPYAKVQQAANLPMMARDDFAMRMPQPEVRYDTGPQPGEATLKGYDPTIKERIYQGIAGTEERPSPERAQFARGMSQMAEFAPVLGNVMAGQEAQRRGDTKGMLMAALPVPGMATEARMAEAAVSPAQEAAREAYQRVLNAQGLYSHAAEAAANLPQAKGSYEQMMAMLQKAGVKPEEMRWSGVEQFAGQPVTREQLVSHFEQNVPKIEESVYTAEDPRSAMYRYGSGTQIAIPGGENYREVLLHTPSQKQDLYKQISQAREDRIAAVKEHGSILKYDDPALEQERLQKIREATKRENDLRAKLENIAPEYTSSHWDQPNVLGHLRMSDRTGPEGEKILHLEELQSDWGQAGRKKGFKSHGEPGGLNAEESDEFKALNVLPDAVRTPQQTQRLNELYAEANRRKSGVPSAPYVEKTQNWTDLGLKRALKEAAEGGYSKMVWTPGEEQAARYDLSKQIGSITARPTPDGKIHLEALTPDMGSVVHNGVHNPNDIDDIIGKELADKIRSQIQFPEIESGYVVRNKRSGNQSNVFKTKEDAEDMLKNYPESLRKDLIIAEGNRTTHGRAAELSGLDLKVGGEGMKGFYDKIVPTRLKELLKKIDPQAKMSFTEIQTKDGPVKVPALEITPKIREAVKRGLPAYAHGGEVVNNTDPYDNIRLKAKNFPRARRASN